ncbi:MAG TPA: hypothetical protein VJZ71_14445 [Phycisphaerae bacterium]|nr:hypothetical protein [Phycisphaerae bacterium]
MASQPLQTALALAFLIVGLSHIVCGWRWKAFFEPIFKNPSGPFVIALMTFPLGLLIVVTHNRWEWDLSVLVTVYGWAALIKGAIYFLVPGLPLKFVTERIRSPRHFATAGCILLVLGALMAYDCVYAG